MFHLLYNEVIYRPLLNLLVFIYNYIPDVGVAIILLTLLVRLVLTPSMNKSIKSQASLTALQPKLNEIKEKYKDNKQEQAKEMMELYKTHKVNPFSSCLPLLIQLPLLIGLFYVFRNGLNNNLGGLYSFVPKPEHINPYFLNFLDLSRAAKSAAGWYVPALILGILTGLAQFWQSKMMQPTKKTGQEEDATVKMMRVQTTWLLPLITIYFSINFPAGLPLYWLVTTLFAALQQLYIFRKHPELKQGSGK